MNRRDVALVGLLTVALALLGARVLAPPSETARRISVIALQIPDAPIETGEAKQYETTWTPPDDVMLVGWSPVVGSPESRPNLALLRGDTVIFEVARAETASVPPVFFPAGTGFLLTRGGTVTLRLQVANSGPRGHTRGARALVYFHPVSWR